MKKVILFLVIFTFTISAQEKRTLTVEDIWNMDRIGSYDLSPDGKAIVFEAASYNMEDNSSNTDIYLIDSDGGNLRAVKNSEKKETKPLFTPDGSRISYLMDQQIFASDLDGSNEEKITDIYTGISDYKWSDEGKKILFISAVYPECSTQECNRKKDEEEKNSEVKAKIFTELMYRHWNDWRGEKRNHLFLFDPEKKEYVDLINNSPHEIPPISLGSRNDFNFSPDGNEVSYTMNEDEFLAASTNNDIFLVDLINVKKDGRIPAEKISESKGNDNQPVYSPDGKYIAFTSMKREGFEADKQNIVLYEKSTGIYRTFLEDFDYSAREIIWSPDSRSIYFTAPNQIYNSIFKLDIETGNTEIILKEHVNSSISVSPDGNLIYFKQQKSTTPEEIFVMNNDGSNVRKITAVNDKKIADIEMKPVETFWSEGEDGKKIQSILIKPPFFDSAKKYPMIFLIHGGPQGHWSDDFHYRWNIQMFAAPGYVVVAPNPRGSVGYGQKFTDEISGDWGGKPYTDLMNAYDYAVNNFNFINSKNTFAAGASYGGYMINWIAGHTDRFNALVSHAGVFNLESEYGTTEELWFPEWEFGGTPWEKREVYEKWSPHRFIHNAETPMLIIHGAMDFRVPEEQAFQLFTSLQRLEVESKFLYFPDESHWVAKPQNAKLWWKTIFEWFNEHKNKEELQ